MKKLIFVLSVTTLIGGCSFIPSYEAPEVDMPASWLELQQQPQKDGEETSQNEAEINTDWWKNFGNEELNSLMEQALADNTDLRTSIYKIEQARAALKSTGASLYPTLDGSGSASRTRKNPADGQTTNTTSLSAGLDVSYELDLFGKNDAEIESARASLDAEKYDKESVALVVMADVADTYFTLLNLKDRLAIADSNLENSKEVLRIIEAEVNGGASSELELAQQKSAVATSEASRASIYQQIKNAENALAVLLGKTPQTLDIKSTTLKDVLVPDIVLVQPSSLLERRPDVKVAEANLIAANADIGAARSAYFPSISLGLGGTVSSTGFSDPSTTVLSLASSLSAPIFSGGELEGNLEQSKAKQKQLVEAYKDTVLTSIQEVEDAIVAMNTAKKRDGALKTAMEQAQKAYQISKRKYDAGSIDFQTLLDTQDTQLSSEDSYAQVKLEHLEAAIDLYKAMGGGWKVGSGVQNESEPVVPEASEEE